ncbi:MAG: hypothetical protein ACYTX0_32535 [Nostoc sp.]
MSIFAFGLHRRSQSSAQKRRRNSDYFVNLWVLVPLEQKTGIKH